MTHRPLFAPTAVLLSTTFAAGLGGCAAERPLSSNDTQIPGRLITQQAPAPDHTVYYWSALRSCLQTGRTEWECKSGEDRFVRDALAIEAELSAQRQQRRQEMRSRAEFEAPGIARTAGTSHAAGKSSRSRSLMLEAQPEPVLPEIRPEYQWTLAAMDDRDALE